MRKIILTTLGILSFGPTSMAVMAPYYESSKEISTILSDERVIERVGVSNEIESISRKGDIYYVITARCILPVHVIYERQSQPGPKHFSLEVGNCRH